MSWFSKILEALKTIEQNQQQLITIDTEILGELKKIEGLLTQPAPPAASLVFKLGTPIKQ